MALPLGESGETRFVLSPCLPVSISLSPLPGVLVAITPEVQSALKEKRSGKTLAFCYILEFGVGQRRE